MSEPRRDSKWWGWGDPAVVPELDAEALGVLRERIGELEPWPLARQLEDFALPQPASLPAGLVDAVGADNVFTGAEDRLRHASGRGYVDLARMRGGELDAAPDAVLMPADADALRRVLDICASEGIAVVPFGGGTSVVGGVEPLRGAHQRLISLDLGALRDVAVDRRSLTARLGAGLRGPEAEAALAQEGLTLGHFPQSFEYATIGGFAATRSAGQASSGYGRFDALVSSIRLLAPAGNLETLETPHTAAGPALRELVVGSEGVLGVIPEVTVRVRPRRGSAATRPGWPGASRPGRRSSAPWPRALGFQTSFASPTRRRLRARSPSRARAASPAPSSAAISVCASAVTAA